MLYIALYLIVAFYLVIVTWVLYLGLMNLKANKNKLTKTVKVIAYPLLFIGLILDVALNIIVGTVAFVELPNECLFTNRCIRHIKRSNFRGKVARWFCRNFLNPFDPSGTHCGG